MKVAETMRLTTTFILAGYKEEIMNLLAYNPGQEESLRNISRALKIED